MPKELPPITRSAIAEALAEQDPKSAELQNQIVANGKEHAYKCFPEMLKALEKIVQVQESCAHDYTEEDWIQIRQALATAKNFDPLAGIDTVEVETKTGKHVFHTRAIG